MPAGPLPRREPCRRHPASRCSHRSPPRAGPHRSGCHVPLGQGMRRLARCDGETATTTRPQTALGDAFLRSAPIPRYAGRQAAGRCGPVRGVHRDSSEAPRRAAQSPRFGMPLVILSSPSPEPGQGTGVLGPGCGRGGLRFSCPGRHAQRRRTTGGPAVPSCELPAHGKELRARCGRDPGRTALPSPGAARHDHIAVDGSWRRGVPAKLGRRGGCGWSRAGVAGDRCAARAQAGAMTGSRVPDGGRAVQPGLAGIRG